MTEPFSVYIVDDDPAMRRSIAFLLDQQRRPSRSFESGEAFLREVDRLEPGCILLDIRMPGRDGLEIQKLLGEKGVRSPVVMITGHGDVAMAVKAMKEGAVDFLEKPFRSEALMNAIERAGQRLERHARHLHDAEEARLLLNGLTPRERDVVAGLARGHPNKTIAYDLGISPRTVEVHRANLMEKLEARSLSDVLRIVFAAEEEG
ncbi:response regulator transcription factor [Sphingomicrobium lutaoense]|uniref:Two-component system response regulator FixJ n=1 Tax=Sphingomicrobium lutaoense TaxID=515949 RepID=A0A839Z5M9_9SPHN|nr:response regulator [Sphingomicrobium lutaoense]MBB3764922.1 two-component system response regulator FixJ [Sphingomicrobium lutaoense]